MDLGAYVQIDELDKIAKDNGIDIPRLRGYRLMKDEEKVAQEEIQEMKRNCKIRAVKTLCESIPFWDPNASVRISNSRTNMIKDYFLVRNRNGYKGIRWDRIHGRKRKILKFEIKKEKRRIQHQYDVWNKYVGREDVLYIHSRMGGNNWKYYEGKTDIMNQPWFLDRVDDCFDSTYCDFYAKIKIPETCHETEDN